MATELNLSKELAKLHLNHYPRLHEIGTLVEAISSPYGFGNAKPQRDISCLQRRPYCLMPCEIAATGFSIWGSKSWVKANPNQTKKIAAIKNPRVSFWISVISLIPFIHQSQRYIHRLPIF